MLPVYDNRYFSSMAQTFEAHVGSAGNVRSLSAPAVIRRRRRETAENLISYSIDELFICGATDPDGVHQVCEAAGLRHINIDLPGTKAHSVISDNYEGGRTLTEAIIHHFPADDPLVPDDLFLFGGRNDHASRERIRGFRTSNARFSEPTPKRRFSRPAIRPIRHG